MNNSFSLCTEPSLTSALAAERAPHTHERECESVCQSVCESACVCASECVRERVYRAQRHEHLTSPPRNLYTFLRSNNS